MSRSRYVQGKDGKFQGSVGEGKTNVPSAQSDLPDPRDEGDTGTASTANISDAYAKYLELTTVQKGDDPMSNDDVLVLFNISRGTSGDDYEDDLAGWTAIASNLPDEQQAFIADRMSLSSRRYLAELETTSPLVLEGMTGDDWYLRELVAGNPSTSAEVLEMLSEYEDEDEDTPEVDDIVAAVARNPSTPPHVLTRLASDHVQWVRDAVAGNASTPVEVLERMADDYWGDVHISSSLANNPITPPFLLARLASHEDDMVRDLVAGNPKTPTEALDRLAQSENLITRIRVAQNPNTSLKTVVLLSKTSTDQGDPSVRLEAHKVLDKVAKLRPDLVERAEADFHAEQGR